MRNPGNKPLPATIIILTLAGVLLAGCSDSMNPPEGEVCEPEVPAAERQMCNVNDGKNLVVESTEDLKILCTTKCDTLFGIGISKTPELENLKPLEGLSEITYFGIGDTRDLKTLTGLGGISLPNGMIIEGNQSLTSLDGFTEDEILQLKFHQNTSLKNLNGLESVQSIGYKQEPEPAVGTLAITENTALKSLDGLENVETLFSLKIFDNEDLERIDALSKVTYIEGSLSITDNPSLTSIESLMGIEKIDKSIRIEGNPSLPSCQVQKFLDSVETNDKYEVNAGNNGTGNCES